MSVATHIAFSEPGIGEPLFLCSCGCHVCVCVFVVEYSFAYKHCLCDDPSQHPQTQDKIVIHLEDYNGIVSHRHERNGKGHVFEPVANEEGYVYSRAYLLTLGIGG